MQISEQLAVALDEFVHAADAAEDSRTDRQLARRVIEQATVVAHLARQEGFGATSPGPRTSPEGAT